MQLNSKHKLHLTYVQVNAGNFRHSESHKECALRVLWRVLL